MLPGVYEFSWDAGHVVFLGAFYLVAMTLVATLVTAIVLARKDADPRRMEAVRWHLDFEDLPLAARSCRHELSGEVKQRTCENGFDCRRCSEHARFLSTAAPHTIADAKIGGFSVPGDRLYHRGHTWVRQESDGLLTVGLDDLGRHLVGRVDAVTLPPPGSRVVANGTAFELRKNGARLRVLSPLDGEVTAVGAAEDDWYLKIQPDNAADTRHLLNAAEAAPWMLREFERLQMSIGGGTLADGGVPVDDLSNAIPPAQFDEVCGLMFLEP